MNSTKSAFHDIELICLGWDEPNNGRMLEAVDLKINGEIVTRRYFGSWNYTDIPQHYEADSPDGRYFFVPAEGGGFVIDTQRDYAPVGISCKGPSASTFRGNLYFNDWLILVHRNEVILFDMQTQKQTSLDFPDNSVWWVKPVSAHQLEISYTKSTIPNMEAMLVAV